LLLQACGHDVEQQGVLETALQRALRQRCGATLGPLDGAALPRAGDALALAQAEFAAGRGIGAGELQPLYLRNRVALTKTEQEAARNLSVKP